MPPHAQRRPLFRDRRVGSTASGGNHLTAPETEPIDDEEHEARLLDPRPLFTVGLRNETIERGGDGANLLGAKSQPPKTPIRLLASLCARYRIRPHLPGSNRELAHATENVELPVDRRSGEAATALLEQCATRLKWAVEQVSPVELEEIEGKGRSRGSSGRLSAAGEGGRERDVGAL